MKWKFIVLGFVVLCLGLSSVGRAQSVTYASLAERLKHRLADGEPDFSDDDLMTCIVMAKIAIIGHGVSDRASYKLYVPGNTQYIALNPPYGSSLDVMFVASVTRYTGAPGDERSLLEVNVKDLGHKQIGTDVPLSYFCFFRDTLTTYIYVFPASAVIESLRIEVVHAGFGTPSFYNNPAFIESILDYALFIAYLRMGNYMEAAKVYNAYKFELALLREEIVNREYDVMLAPKIIK